MPWEETCVMDSKVKFIGDYLRGTHTVTDLARAYGISRQAAYKWIERYQQEGLQGLEPRSRAPKRRPHATSDALVEQIIATKRRYQHLGPKKIVDLLKREQPDVKWPADSTCGEILKRAGLVKPRRRKRPIPADASPFNDIVASNDSWSADFKGDFELQNRQRCYPLTITDNSSRFMLQCRGLSRINYQDTHDWFEFTFREYGLPNSIRTDNGPPFASRAAGGLSRLSKWWVDLEIKVERTRPGTPTENARHERMHRSLKEAVCQPPSYSLERQQARFETYKREYNELRSHEGLGRQTPASQYQASERQYTGIILPPEYDSHVQVRSVKHNGEIKWKGQLIYVAELLAKSRVSLSQIDDQRYELRYRTHRLGIINEETMRLEPATEWHGSSERKL